ncbi:MAG TPA: helix-turn-helix transcriptional regulator [Polyangiaceae bacterium]|nr:helix-turn-helix transcriptional regulator [Polyangiaceae bacterium]
MLDQSLRRKLAEYGEAFRDANTLHELSGHVVESVRSHIDTNGVCFLPMGPTIPFGTHGVFSHDQFSSDMMRNVTLASAPVVERDSGGIAGLLRMDEKTLNLNELLGPRGLKRTEMFNEYWRPYRLDRQLLALFGSSASPIGFVAVSRTECQASFRSKDVALLNEIRVRLSEPLNRLIHGDERRDGLLPVALAAGLPLASALFDARGRVLWASEQARAGLDLGQRGPERTLTSGSMELAVWRNAAFQVIVQRQAVFHIGDITAHRVETTSGVPMALVTRKQHWREPLDERLFRVAQRYTLTARESEVLLRLATGLSNKEIAADLGCSRRTVEVHVTNILKKSGCSSRLELVTKC